MRIGIYGGSFDPVHYGHLLLAECCREQCRLDQVWYVPACIPPHKQDAALSSTKDRLAMLELAHGGHESFHIWQSEVERGGVSYTVDTLEELARQQPDAELFFLMGADSLSDLPTWREPRRICELAIPLVVRRVGSAEPDMNVLAEIVTPERLNSIQNSQVEMPLIELSSSEIRRRVAAGQSVRYQTPRAVEKYIETHRLYQTANLK